MKTNKKTNWILDGFRKVWQIRTNSNKVNTLTECQEIIRTKIEAAVKATKYSEIEYKTEWLGYLPYGVYQWVECLTNDISSDFPSGWEESDLLVLEHTGFLEKIDEYRNPNDEYDICRKYQVNLEIGTS